jgi:hypothetical protein
MLRWSLDEGDIVMLCKGEDARKMFVGATVERCSGDQLANCPFSILAHVSFRATVRLNSGFPGFESGSAQKYPMRSN